MSKAERIGAEIEKKMDESGALACEADGLAGSLVYCLPGGKKGLAEIYMHNTPAQAKATGFIRMNDRHCWTLPELEAFVAWAHEMLDDEPK